MKKKFIDISVSLKSDMVHWPSDPPVKIKRINDMKKGAKNNISFYSFGSHTATHMDAPLHFIKGARSLDKMPLDVTVGPCRVITIKDKESIKVEELKKKRIKKGERILFKTLNSKRCWKTNKFVKDFVYLSTEGAQYLAKLKPRLIGVDYLSIGGYKNNGTPVHRAILGAGIWVIEGLNLQKTKPGRYHLICLPLKVLNSDGAPARAVLTN